MRDNVSVRQWQTLYCAGAFASKNRTAQIEAGWYDWFCRDESLAGRLKKLAPVAIGITDPFILDNYYVWFKNNCPACGPLYDDTERFGFHAPEFGCGHVRDMVQYITVMAREMQQGVRPAFLDEKAAAVEYVLRRDTVRSSRSLQRVGEHSYSFQDWSDGRRKTVHVASRLEDAPPGYQVERAVQINGLYVFCPDDADKTPDIPVKSKKHSKKKKSEVDR